MSTKYGKVVNEGINQSDVDIGYPHPQLQERPHPNHQVNILEGPGYKLFEAQSQVSKWKKIINIFGWVCIVYGTCGVLANIVALIFVDAQDFEVKGPGNRYEEFDYPIGPQVVDVILNAVAYLTIVILGNNWRKTCLSPTRYETWVLCKRAIFIAFIQFFILAIRFFAVWVAISMVIKQWESKSDLDRGNYEIRNKQTGEVFRYYKPRSRTDKGKEIEKEEKEQAGAFFYLTMFSAFSVACWIVSVCCAFTIGGLYKLHITTKELEIIQDLPSVRDLDLNRQISSGAPVYHYRPDPSSSIARGQVIMNPNIQS